MNFNVFTNSQQSIPALKQAFSSLEQSNVVVTIEYTQVQPKEVPNLAVFHSMDEKNNPFSPTSRRQLLLTGQHSAREILHALSLAFSEFDDVNELFSEQNCIFLELVR